MFSSAATARPSSPAPSRSKSDGLAADAQGPTRSKVASAIARTLRGYLDAFAEELPAEGHAAKVSTAARGRNRQKVSHRKAVSSRANGRLGGRRGTSQPGGSDTTRLSPLQSTKDQTSGKSTGHGIPEDKANQ
jgi:hypothetical protein